MESALIQTGFVLAGIKVQLPVPHTRITVIYGQ